MTEEQIVKALECCIVHESCEGCPCAKDNSQYCLKATCKNALDLIKRLKSQNKEFDEKIVIQLGTIDWQAKEINRQKAEIERLKKERYIFKDGVLELLPRTDIEEIQAEAIKEYKEKVKAILMDKGIYPVVVKNALNEAEKEMVGENDV